MATSDIQKNGSMQDAMFYAILLSFCACVCGEIAFPEISVYDQKRSVQLAIFFAFSLNIIVSDQFRKDMLDAWARLPKLFRKATYAVGVLGVVSSVLASLPKHAFQELALFGFLFLLTLYLSTRLSSVAAHRLAVGVIGLAVSLYGWRYLTGAYLPSLIFSDPLGANEQVIGFSHPRFLNQFQSWTLPFLTAIPIVFSCISRPYRWMTWLPGTLSWALLFATSGRGATVATAVALMSVVVIFRGRSLVWAKTHLMLAIFGLIVYAVFFIFIPPYLGLEHEPSTVIQRLGNDGLMGRDRLWGRALELWIGQPIFGIGPQQYSVFELQNIAAHPHSAPLQWLSEWGIISFCIVSALLFWGAIGWVAFSRKFVNEATAQQSVILISVTASLVAGSVHGLVSGVIVMPLSQLTMCLIVGWALAIYHGSCRTAGVREQPRSSEQRGLVILVLLLTATLTATSYPEIAMGERRTSRYTDSHPEEKGLRPRFWQQGYIGW